MKSQVIIYTVEDDTWRGKKKSTFHLQLRIKNKNKNKKSLVHNLQKKHEPRQTFWEDTPSLNPKPAKSKGKQIKTLKK